MRLEKLFTAGLVAVSMCGFANPTQVTGQEPTASVEVEKPAAQEDKAAMAASDDSKAAPAEMSSKPVSAQQGRIVLGDELSLSPVIEAEWIKGEAPTTFEPGLVYMFECWSTKCGPCIAMIPHVNDLHKKYYSKGLRVYGMSVYENDMEECKEFVKEKGDGMSYPVAFTGKGGPFEREWMRPTGAKGIPHAFIVRNGKLLASTLAERLTDELIEMMLEGDAGAEKAGATILAAQIHQAKIDGLLSNIMSARRKRDTETMTANIEKLKLIDPENPEILVEELWVLMIDEKWADAVAALNGMSENWAKDSFVSMNGMRMARGRGGNYPAEFEKALIHSYSDYVHNKEYVGPNHFACLSILQWKIGEKENAVSTADKILKAANTYADGNEARVTPFVRFKDSVNEGTMPEFSELSEWMREARKKAADTQ